MLGGQLLLILYRNFCARSILRKPNEEPEQKQMDICRRLMFRWLREGDEFLCSTVNGGKSWVHHFENFKIRDRMEFRHNGSPAPKKFKTAFSAAKVMLTAFWYVNGVVQWFPGVSRHPGVSGGTTRCVAKLKKIFKLRLMMIINN
jgi:hypothetical protein